MSKNSLLFKVVLLSS